MENEYDALFTPLKLGKLTLKNRIVMAPMDNGFSGIDERVIAYLAERAKGGTAMVMTGAILSTTLFKSDLDTLADQTTLFNIAYLAEAVHAGGGALCVQIGPGEGRNTVDKGTGLCYSASDDNCFVWMPQMKCTALTVDQIHQILNETKAYAGKLKAAGVDAIDVHAHNGYLLDQFMSQVWNHRTDEYGGSFENRMRFMKEYIQAIRDGAGPDMPIIPHLTFDMTIPGMRQPGESEEIMKYLDNLDIQGFVLDWGCYECIDKIIPSAYYGDDCEMYMADALRALDLKKPIMISGNLTPDSAAKAVSEGKIDAAVFGRPLLADAEIANKLLRNEAEEIRPCLVCGMCLSTKPIRGLSCAVNAEMGNEDAAKLVKPCKKQKVVIVGGGVGGMEAARMAAVRGAEVVLMEKSGKLGGTALDMATASWMQRYPKYIAWAERQLKKLGVKIMLNTEVSEDCEELKTAARIFVATGAKPVPVTVPGAAADALVNVLDVHKDKSLAKGENILIVNGDRAGADLALELAEMGKKVSVVEFGPMIGRGAFGMNFMTLMSKLPMAGVGMYPNAHVRNVNGTSAEIVCGEKELTLQADTIIVSPFMVPDNDLGYALMCRYPGRVQLIGDARNGSKVYDAVHDGYNAAMSLE